MSWHPPRSTRTYPLFPSTTLCRSLPFPWTTLLVVPGIDDLLHGGPEIRFVAGHELQRMDVRGGRDEGVHHADRPARCLSARDNLSPAIGDHFIHGQHATPDATRELVPQPGSEPLPPRPTRQ